ncbi:hypothetical protein [Haloterrigena turkmenica]|nr:hypothetical protein [Haloterrigena turkmenica]
MTEETFVIVGCGDNKRRYRTIFIELANLTERFDALSPYDDPSR